MNEDALILWLSALNTEKVAKKLRNHIVRFLFPVSLRLPFSQVKNFPHSYAVYFEDGLQEFPVIRGNNNPMTKYTRVCCGIVFRPRHLWFFRLFKFPGFITNKDLEIKYP